MVELKRKDIFAQSNRRCQRFQSLRVLSAVYRPLVIWQMPIWNDSSLVT